MARIGAKPPCSVTSSEVARELDELSKAALIDLYCQQLALNLGDGDTPVTLAQVREDAVPMLELRGDTTPRSWLR